MWHLNRKRELFAYGIDVYLCKCPYFYFYGYHIIYIFLIFYLNNALSLSSRIMNLIEDFMLYF